MHKLEKFLRENNALEAFRENYNSGFARHIPIEEWFDKNYSVGAFFWKDTEQGYDYWSNLQDKIYEEEDNIKEEDKEVKELDEVQSGINTESISEKDEILEQIKEAEAERTHYSLLLKYHSLKLEMLKAKLEVEEFEENN